MEALSGPRPMAVGAPEATARPSPGAGARTMYVITSLNGGGEARLLLNVLLREEDAARVLVVTFLGGGAYRPLLEAAGIRVCDLGMTRHRQLLAGASRLASLIRTWRPDVVQAWNYDANLLSTLAWRLTGRRARLFWGVFNTDLRSTRPIVRVICWLSALLSRHVAGIVYNAAEARAFHRRIGFREPCSIVIANGVDGGAFRPDSDRRTVLRTVLGVRHDDVVVAVVARVHPMKDWRSMLEAVRGLPGIVTLAVGEGTERLPDQPGLVRLGWRDDVSAILSAADLFFLGSAFGEGTSLALNEAMLCGLCCVATDTGDNARLVADCGVVVEPRNPAAMRAAIRDLAADPERRVALGRAARSRALALGETRRSLRDLHAIAPGEA